MEITCAKDGMMATLGGGDDLYGKIMKMTRAVAFAEMKRQAGTPPEQALRNKMMDFLIHYGYLQDPYTGKVYTIRSLECSSSLEIARRITLSGIKSALARDMETLKRSLAAGDPQALMAFETEKNEKIQARAERDWFKSIHKRKLYNIPSFCRK